MSKSENEMLFCGEKCETVNVYQNYMEIYVLEYKSDKFKRSVGTLQQILNTKAAVGFNKKQKD